MSDGVPNPAEEGEKIDRDEARSHIKKMLEARHSYLFHRSLGAASEANQEALHANLHTSVMTVWEALRPHAVSASQGRVTELWEDVKLWPIQQKREHVTECDDCGGRLEGLQRGDACPECGGEVVINSYPVTNAAGDPEYVYECGLASLHKHQGREEVHTVKTGNFNQETKTVRRPQRLRPEYLFRAARLLDELAVELNIIAPEAKPVANPHKQGEV